MSSEQNALYQWRDIGDSNRHILGFAEQITARLLLGPLWMGSGVKWQVLNLKSTKWAADKPKSNMSHYNDNSFSSALAVVG